FSSDLSGETDAKPLREYSLAQVEANGHRYRHAAAVAEMLDDVARHFKMIDLHLVGQLLQHEAVRLVKQEPVDRRNRHAGGAEQALDHGRHFGLHEVEHGGPVHAKVVLGPQIAV